MTFALGVEPVAFAVFVGVIDVAGEGLGRCRRGRSLRFGPEGLGRRFELRADQRRFAGPFFERFVPGKGDQRAGHYDFEKETHRGAGGVLPITACSGKE